MLDAKTAAGLGILTAPKYGDIHEPDFNILSVTVGPQDADLVGETNMPIQAAIDFTASMGGGIVRLLPGRYVMHDSLHLKSNVVLQGAGQDTVLVKAPMVKSAVVGANNGYGHYDLTVAEPDEFRPGMGVCISDSITGGFYSTVATVRYIYGNRLGISRSLNADCRPHNNGVVRSVFPVISAYDCEDCVIRDLRIEGSANQNEWLDGCRGGGVFLLRAHRARLLNITVEDYNGDGVSFQQCIDPFLENVACRGNRGHGFHPGSGSLRPQMKHLIGEGNANSGLYYCLRTTGGLLEDSVFVGNGDYGIHFGLRDTDQTIRECIIRENQNAGLCIGGDDPFSANSRATVEACTIQSNCLGKGEAEVCLRGAVTDMVFRDNRIGPATQTKSGILIGKNVGTVTMEGNEIEGPGECQVVDGRSATC